jgi:hydroxymethylpyrimidine/phosphomethylpyrimidine kinase
MAAETRHGARIALTIAGSDSGGGAGIQADLKTFSAFGIYGASVITAITAQNTRGVIAVERVSPGLVRAQIDAVLSDLRVDAIKIGMLADAEIVAAVADGLADYAGPIVLDPVMVAKSGDALLRDDAVDALIAHLVPRAALVTPNLPEAERMTGETDPHAQAEALLAMGARAVLIKGGHGTGDVCIDRLYTDNDERSYPTQRISTRNTHGTGCTFSSAIAAYLTRGAELGPAVHAAQMWLRDAIRAADSLRIGSGHGPVHHFHDLWP